jgi:hypothetical protein
MHHLLQQRKGKYSHYDQAQPDGLGIEINPSTIPDSDAKSP